MSLLFRRAGVVTAGALAAMAVTITPAAAGQWRDGAHVYQKVCAHCHEAGVGPVIKGRSLAPDYIQSIVRHGNRAMPAFRPTEIDSQSLAEVARLVSTSTPLAQQ